MSTTESGQEHEYALGSKGRDVFETLCYSRTGADATYWTDKLRDTKYAKHAQHAKRLQVDHNVQTGSEYRSMADETKAVTPRRTG
jgi:hypothetical protein